MRQNYFAEIIKMLLITYHHRIRFHANVRLFPVSQEHVPIVVPVKLEIPLAANVIVSVGNALVRFELLLARISHHTRRTLVRPGSCVMALVLLQLLFGRERFNTNFAQEVRLKLKQKSSLTHDNII